MPPKYKVVFVFQINANLFVFVGIERDDFG